MLNLCVIGAGLHSRTYHLPALAHYKALGGDFALSAICDADAARASAAARDFGFRYSFNSLDQMLDQMKPDACMAIIPVATTTELSLKLLREGCPVLVEKPLGANIEQARAFVSHSRAARGAAMVSMNRRFDPIFRAALDWVGPRPIKFIRGCMARTKRVEENFISETGLHLIDVVRSIAGEVTGSESNARLINGALWWTVRLSFASGTGALVEIQPTADANKECLQFFGEEFVAEARSAEFDDGLWRGWSAGRLVREEISDRATPPFVANGTFAETKAFLDSVRHGLALKPTPGDVLSSMEICHRAIAAVDENRLST